MPLIFAYFVSKWGIIYPVDEDNPVTEMEEHFYTSVPILKIFRVTRREGDDRIPTMRVKIIFKKLIPPRFLRFMAKLT